MKIALRSQETSTFFLKKKVITRNIKKCFYGKTYFIIRNTYILKIFFVSVGFFRIDFYRIKAKGG